jgi:hypothetical protein
LSFLTSNLSFTSIGATCEFVLSGRSGHDTLFSSSLLLHPEHYEPNELVHICSSEGLFWMQKFFASTTAPP